MADGIGAVLLDAGGTLFRLRGSVGGIYAEIAARYDIELPASVLEERFQAVFPRMPGLCFPGVPPSALHRLERRWWHLLVSQVFGRDTGRDFEAMFTEIFDYFASGTAWDLFPETLEVLELLRRRRLRVAIVSNFDARLLRICDDLGISPRVDAVIASGRAGYAKPDPRIFLLALRRLGFSPGQAVHVGDSEREDIGGARSAGLHAVLLQRQASGETSRAEVIDDLGRLLDRL